MAQSGGRAAFAACGRGPSQRLGLAAVSAANAAGLYAPLRLGICI